MRRILIAGLTVLLFSVQGLYGQETKTTFQQAREEFNEGIRKGLDQQYEQALEHFLAAIELNPHFAEAHLYCGISLIELGEFSQAIKKITVAREIDPALSDQAFYFRGLAKCGVKDYSGAIHDYSQAIMINPDHISFFQRGKAHFSLGHYGKALQDFEVTLRMKPDFAQGVLFRGKSLYHIGLLSEALDDLNRAAGSFPDDPQVYSYRSMVYRDLDNPMAAQENLQMAEQLQKTAPADDNLKNSSSPLLASTSNEQMLHASGTILTVESEKEETPVISTENASYVIQPGFYDHNLAEVESRDGFGVQVASFSASHKLVGLASAYRERYQQPVFIHVSELNGHKLFKIILGNFDQRSQVESLRNTLREAEFKDCFIVNYEQLK